MVACPLCGISKKNFNSARDLNDHMKIHSENSYYCDKCGKDCQTPRGLYRHQNKYHKDIECSSCAGKFASKAGLNKHTKSQHQNSTHVCDICTKEFTSIDSFKRHKKSCNIKVEPTFVCPIESCKMVFVNKENLVKHMKQNDKATKLQSYK